MTTFGWKRKAGANVSHEATNAFLDDAQDEDDPAITSGDIDWLTLAPQKKAMALEDAVAKSNRLKDEGITLAEAERYWEALRKWEQALQLTPDDEKILDMKAQAYLHLNELYPAVQTAERTLEVNSLWWVAHQTLGRARLGLGEVRTALKCFSRAVHLNPADTELWEEDLRWCAELVARKKLLEEEALTAAETSDVQITEIADCETEHGNAEPEVTCTRCDTRIKTAKDCSGEEASTSTTSTEDVSHHHKLKNIPQNYVAMRD